MTSPSPCPQSLLANTCWCATNGSMMHCFNGPVAAPIWKTWLIKLVHHTQKWNRNFTAFPYQSMATWPSEVHVWWDIFAYKGPMGSPRCKHTIWHSNYDWGQLYTSFLGMNYCDVLHNKVSWCVYDKDHMSTFWIKNTRDPHSYEVT